MLSISVIGAAPSTMPRRHVFALCRLGFVGDHAVEKIRRRQLLFVADDNDPPAARDKAQGIFRAHLTGLVDDQEIEIDRTRRQELRDGDRAHEKDRLDLLDGVARHLHQLAQRHVAALAADLGAYDAHAALRAARDRRLMPRAHAAGHGLARSLLEAGEPRDKRVLPVRKSSRPRPHGARQYHARWPPRCSTAKCTRDACSA